MQAWFALASWSSLPGEGEPQVNSYYPHPRWIARLHDGFQFEFQTLFSPLIDLDYDDTIIGYISYPSKYMGGIPRQGQADRERQKDRETVAKKNKGGDRKQWNTRWRQLQT